MEVTMTTNLPGRVTVVVAMVALGCVFGVAVAGVGGVGGPDETSVSLIPNTADASPGDTVTYEVVVADAGASVGAHETTVTVADPTIGEIVGVELAGDPGLEDVNVADDGATATVEAALMDTEETDDLSILKVDVAVIDTGTTDLDLMVGVIADDEGNPYTVSETNGATLAATETDPTDPDFTTTLDNVGPTEGSGSLTVTANATVENVGATGSETVPLYVDGERVAETTLDLDTDETDAVSFEHVFDTPGKYNVSVGDSKSTVVTLYPVPSIDLAGNESSVAVEEQVSLDVTVSTESAKIDEFVWTLPNGETTVTDDSTIVTSFDDPGTKSVEVTAVDEFSATDTAEVSIDVRDAPDASFRIDADPEPDTDIAPNGDAEVGGELTLDATDAAAAVAGDVTWDIAGTETSIDENDPVVTIDADELTDIDVTLTVEDEVGITNSTSQTITVVDTIPPDVSVDAGPDDGDVVGETNPLLIDVTVTDETHESTEVVIKDSDGDAVYTTDVSATTGDGETASLIWDVTDGDGTPVDSGTYDVVVTSVDAAGNTETVTEAVTIDTATPNGSVDTVLGDGVTVDDIVYANETVTMTVHADDGRADPGPVEDVEVVLSAAETAYDESFTATQIDATTWNATGDLDDLSLEGAYTVTAVITDSANNQNQIEWDNSVVHDETEPGLATTIERHGDEIELTVRANETLTEPPSVTVTTPSGERVPVSVTPSDDELWTGTIDTADEGTYDIVATGTDLAGNVGSDQTTTRLQSVSTEDRTVTVLNEDTGTVIELVTDEEVADSFVTIAENDVPPNQLDDDLVGVGFVTSQLGEDLQGSLMNATIYVPADEEALPASASVDDVTVNWYDSAADEWSSRETSVETATFDVENTTVEGTYWTTTVDHFSTYGTVVADDNPPDVSVDAPSDLAHDDDEATIFFTYTDDLSGVDVSTIEIFVDGDRATVDGNAHITDDVAQYTLDLDPGMETTVTIEMADKAGNDVQEQTTVTVPEAEEPTVIDVTNLDGATIDAEQEIVDLVFDYTATGVDKDATTLEIEANNDDWTVSPTIANGEITYKLDVEPDTEYETTLIFVDEFGEVREVTVEFVVEAEDGSDNGGAGGGGGGGGGPPSEGDIVDIDIFEFDDETTFRLSDIPQAGEADIETGEYVVGDALTISRIWMDFRFEPPDFRVEVSHPRADPMGTSPLPDEVGSAVGYLAVDIYNSDHRTMAETKVTLDVNGDALPDDVEADDLTVYQFVDDEWMALDTTTTNGRVEATLESYSAEDIAVAADVTSDSTDDSTESAGDDTDDSSPAEAQDTTQAQNTDRVFEVPGFGVSAAVIAFLVTMTLARCYASISG